ncbi:hypothetical protein KUTeg_025014 [Tegillarca granosa]|uniref:Neurotransmitter-gated ion-channel ligand-binding domain-containing protein n=1 Tax=Tegillarca granosa TaxID=220873 RepID=A0ABQ9E599_TEGGR|nr:hypothetical protein KUTeg_025014 [Tegillarca granosa]
MIVLYVLNLTFYLINEKKTSMRSEIWLPDLVVYNDISLSSLNNNEFDIKVYPNGRVTWWPFGKYETNCLVDTTKHPFDERQCEIIISPLYSYYKRMKLNYKSKLLDTQLF